MHEKLFKNPRIFVANFAVENFELFIADSSSAQIYTKGRSILVSKTYKILGKIHSMELINFFWGMVENHK